MNRFEPFEFDQKPLIIKKAKVNRTAKKRKVVSGITKKDRMDLKKFEKKVIALNKKMNEQIKNKKSCKKQPLSETLEKAKKIRLSAKKRKAKKVKTDEPNPDSTSAPVPVPLPVPEVEESVASPEPEVPSAVDETSSTEEQQSSPESVPSSTEIDVDESPAASPEEDKSVFSKVADSVKSAVGLGEEEKTGGRRYRKGKKGKR